ncbi:MAG: helix-turn-helix domain-containing protein [Acidobacteriota bacterium]|nr:helix-turn-helix domain-containing protein [Acidobacteriota bacterium]
MTDNIYDAVPAPLGQQIRTLRRARSWTLEDLARRADTSAPTIHRYEGGWSRFELRTLRKIAAALGARLDVRLTRVDAPLGAQDRTTTTKRTLRRLLAPLFWDADFRESHLDEHRDWVLGRVLMFGGREQVAAVREWFGDDAIRRAVRRRGIDEKTRNYWVTVLEDGADASEGAR